MRTTIDRAGRIVIPKELRDRVGLVPGEVDIDVRGSSVVIESIPGGRVVEEDGRLVVEATGVWLTDADVRRLRLADQP